MEDVLRLMKKPVNTPLDLAMAKEVCLRDGTIQELVTGKVEKLGSVYLLSANIVDPMTGAILQSVSEDADSATAISAAVRRLEPGAQRRGRVAGTDQRKAMPGLNKRQPRHSAPFSFIRKAWGL